MCDLSIIIPAYNAEQFVFRCLESIMSSIDIDDYEILFIDDGSTDHTIEVVTEFCHLRNLDNLKVIHQENARQGAARNNGISKANGKYIMFVDVDDYLNNIDIKLRLQEADKYNLDIYRFSTKVYDADGKYEFSYVSQLDEGRTYSGLDSILLGYDISGVYSALYSRRLLQRTKIRFREDIAHEDCEFILRLLPHVERLMVSSTCLYSYCWNKDSTDRNRSRNNILHLKRSDIIVAKSYFETADLYSTNKNLNKYYYRKGNSLMMQIIISLIQNTDKLTINDRLSMLEYAIQQNVFPIKTLRTQSWKTTILRLFLNKPKIVSLLFRCFP